MKKAKYEGTQASFGVPPDIGELDFGKKKKVKLPEVDMKGIVGIQMGPPKRGILDEWMKQRRRKKRARAMAEIDRHNALMLKMEELISHVDAVNQNLGVLAEILRER